MPYGMNRRSNLMGDPASTCCTSAARICARFELAGRRLQEARAQGGAGGDLLRARHRAKCRRSRLQEWSCTVSDLRRPAEPGWREIATAPRDGTFVRLERFGRVGGYVTPEIGQWAGGVQRREFENDEELGGEAERKHPT